jgi:hypothetical protein
MNRAERRRLPKAAQAVADNLHTVRCPDCDNDTELVEVDGMYIVKVLHDPTCPWLHQYKARRV